MGNTAVLNKKECKSCNEVFSLKNFHIDRDNADNRKNICRKCATERSKKWNQDNKEKVRSKTKEYYYANKEKISKQARIHRLNNLEMYREYAHKRRAKEKLAPKYLILKKEIRSLYNQPCFNCGSVENQTIEHLIPIDRGGYHGIGNLATLCLSCNQSKRNLTLMEWRISGRYRSSLKNKTILDTDLNLVKDAALPLPTHPTSEPVKPVSVICRSQ